MFVQEIHLGLLSGDPEQHHGPIKMGKIGRRRPRLRNPQPRAALQCGNRDSKLVFFVLLTTGGSLRSHA
jgi:hypothetical protein